MRRRGRTHLERDALGPAHALVGRNDDGGARIHDAVVNGLGREAGENDGVDGADAGAGEHGDADVGHDGHVDGHSVPLANAEGAEQVGQAAHLVVQLLVRDVPCVARVVALPDERRLLRAARQVPIDAIEADVELGVEEPGHVPALEAARAHRRRRYKERQVLPQHLQPKGVRVGPDGPRVQRLVGLQRSHVRPLGRVGRRSHRRNLDELLSHYEKN